MLAIATYATENYCYALEAQAPLVVASLRYAQIDPSQVEFIFAGDASKACAAAFSSYKRRLDLMKVGSHQLKLNVKCNANGSHQKESNLVIAQLQQAAFDQARCLGATQLWSLEADILPRPNVLRSLLDALAFDRGWYSIANALYGNEETISGHGTPQNWILPNVYPDERDVPPDLRAWLDYRDRRKKDLAQRVQIVSHKGDARIEAVTGEQPSPEEQSAWAQLDRDIDAAPPKGNVHELNAIRWRRRGWFQHAYPGIGRGAMVPVEWAGMGCNLLNEKALNLLNFSGYDGGCTQDLWLYWRCLHQANLNAVAVSHALCDHVKLRTVKIKETGKDGQTKEVETKQPVVHHMHHQLGTERYGHLNQETRPWDGL